MKFESQVVHAGDRKRRKDAVVPSTTPIQLATTYFYDSATTLDRVLGHEEDGFCYARYASPTNAALEELCAALEHGHGALATASGMSAVQIALQAALVDRPHSIIASNSIYGATIGMLDQLFSTFETSVTYVDICDLDALQNAVAEHEPGCIFIESISNPLLRVCDLQLISELAIND
jgi:O-acetylhomoserine/O-acetylserine sulfhydrylase-like pyridoxal-dependent enzyme